MSTFTAAVLAQPGPISDLTDRMLRFLAEQRVEPRAAHHVALIVEELLTNIGTHGGSLEKPVRISLTVEAEQVMGEIVDAASPFDPHQAPDPDVESGAEDRTVGGLGLFLVRRFTSSLEYEHRNGENYTKFVVLRDEKAGSD